MNQQEIKETATWLLYEKGRNFHRETNIYTDTDRNYRFYSGNQWEGVKLGDIETLQENFIEPTVKYKLAVLFSNLYAINYSSMNFGNTDVAKMAKYYTKMLNRYAAQVWERDKMDDKCYTAAEDAAINDEGIIYIDFDDEKLLPINELVDKNDIYYGDENSPDIQSQPYILIRRRMPLSKAIKYAEDNGVSDTDLIIADTDTFDQSGDAAKHEVDNQVTLVFKFYKENETVHFSVSSRLVDIIEDTDIGISLYPIAHFNWKNKKGSARGEGEVRNLIPNQIEVNKILMRMVLTSKLQSYPRTVVDIEKILNPEALNSVGSIIKAKGNTVDDVRKVVGTIPPAQMSADVMTLKESIINNSRELAGAGEAATGQVDINSTTSGRAVLAVQQAAQAPLNIQKERFKSFIEDIAKIWLEYLIAYSKKGVDLEYEHDDETVEVIRVSQKTLRDLQAVVKIDVTPRSSFDKFAQEQTLENMFVQGLFSPQRAPELKAYVESLDDDSVAPKQKLQKIVDNNDREQMRIAEINARAQMLQQQAQQFFMQDADTQAQRLADEQMRRNTINTASAV